MTSDTFESPAEPRFPGDVDEVFSSVLLPVVPSILVVPFQQGVSILVVPFQQNERLWCWQNFVILSDLSPFASFLP